MFQNTVGFGVEYTGLAAFFCITDGLQVNYCKMCNYLTNIQRIGMRHFVLQCGFIDYWNDTDEYYDWQIFFINEWVRHHIFPIHYLWIYHTPSSFLLKTTQSFVVLTKLKWNGQTGFCRLNVKGQIQKTSPKHNKKTCYMTVGIKLWQITWCGLNIQKNLIFGHYSWSNSRSNSGWFFDSTESWIPIFWKIMI